MRQPLLYMKIIPQAREHCEKFWILRQMTVGTVLAVIFDDNENRPHCHLIVTKAVNLGNYFTFITEQLKAITKWCIILGNRV